MVKTHFPGKIRKRDGSLVAFDKGRIYRAVLRAASGVLREQAEAESAAAKVSGMVANRLAYLYKDGSAPGVEAVQNMVETVLMSEGYSRIARAYILYREERSRERMARSAMGLTDDLKLPINTLEVLKKRYLLRDDQQNVRETPAELFRRVASCIAQGESNFRSKLSAKEAEERFYYLMRDLEFMPNAPTLMNAGTSMGQLSACFVIPIEDSIDGIFEGLKSMARIHQTGGGTGFGFSRLRPKGDIVSSTKGEASGPVSFMQIFDEATKVIVQGGRRRGANMGILRCDHPDIIEFIEAKAGGMELSNFNISVAVTEGFMRAVLGNGSFNLVNPRTKKRTATLKARDIFERIVDAAWKTGDPGLLFIDEINRHNPLPGLGDIEATNPCGELPLLPYESCNLASINLAKMSRGATLEWDKFRERIHWGIRFLDDVIEVNRFPLPGIKKITRANRKVGLGVMGFADLLIKLGIPYNSKEAVAFAQKVMHFMRRESLAASVSLAKERGAFPNLKASVYPKKNLRPRNATVNTIAPTGTISIISGCSSGIEPLFAVSFVRNVLSGSHLFEVNPYFEELARERGFYSQGLMGEIAREPSLKKVKGIPEDIKRIFVTAFDVEPGAHLDIQAAFQRYTDNSVSKTINLPNEATPQDIRKIYLSAYKLKCKGITVYRYGTKSNQVLSFGGRKNTNSAAVDDLVKAEPEYSGGCALEPCPV
jgi:ribonucleoside-diphosphate reductase alpha chain